MPAEAQQFDGATTKLQPTTHGRLAEKKMNTPVTSRMTLTPLNPNDRLDTPPEILQYGHACQEDVFQGTEEGELNGIKKSATV